MTTPTVSVIVPVFNGERYVAEALDSIAAQTYRDCEIIVVDDCSTDRTAEIVSSWMRDYETTRALRRRPLAPCGADHAIL